MNSKAIIKKDSNEEYHGNKEYVSSSVIKKFKRSPLHSTVTTETTPAMQLGTAYHSYVLEPDLFEKEYFIFDEALRPEPDKTFASNLNKAWKAEIYDLHAGKVLTKETMNEFQAMRSLLFSHPYAKYLLTTGESELSHYVDYKGIKVKIRTDKINVQKRLITDLKTTSDASRDKFFRTAGDLGYHISGAMYCDVAEYIYETGDLWNFILIAQETSKPYPFAIYKASTQFMQSGRYEFQQCLDHYEYCKLTGIYKGYEVFANNKYGIQEINLPAYMQKDINFYNSFDN